MSWSPNAKEFVVVYGTMPAKAKLFDHRANAMFDFGNAARNQAKFNPHGRLLFIGGFGNLNGEMDVWDRKNLKKVASMQASNASSCDWCPDGRTIMTSTLYKRLKVDNGIRFWHYTGVLLHKIEVKELHQAVWKPEQPDVWPERSSLSPPPQGIAEPVPVKEVKKYVPPSQRNNPDAGGSSRNIFDRDAIDSGSRKPSRGGSRSSIPGAAMAEQSQNGKNKNNNKRQGKKVAIGDENSASVAGASENIKPGGPGVVAGSMLETEKKIKTLSKKLKQIATLKERQLAGETLELTQLEKITKQAQLQKEMKELEESMN